MNQVRSDKYWDCKQIPLESMGVLAPGSAHARPSAQPPIDVSGNFPAHMSGAKSGNSKHFFFCKPIFIFVWGGSKKLKFFSNQFSPQIKQF